MDRAYMAPACAPMAARQALRCNSATLFHIGGPTMNEVRIGCAGWSVSRATAPDFPADGSHLQRYAAVLNAAEINSSFYRPHQPQTYARWADSVPDDFRFSVKLPRAITHDRRLAGSGELLADFAGQAEGLGRKLGCVLVQLPPSLVLDTAVADVFFAQLRARLGCAIACEARNASWFDDDATALQTHHGVSRVRADPPAGHGDHFVATTSMAYLRLHGSPRMYYSSYADDQLAQLARYMAGQAAWCIFDNTASGAAVANALTLQRLFK
jgi:uncharacterized protein YecE (DUF72 family)